MGITIHYKGKINSTKLIDSFLEEIDDITKSLEWETTSFSGMHETKGFFITPHPDAEFIQIMIDKEGHLRNAIMMEHLSEDEESTFLCHTKTQFAPIEVHIAIIKLFKYLKEKYISNLEIYDEGKYWKTSDKEVLQERFNCLNEAMDKLEGILRTMPFQEGDDAQTIADKIEAILKQRWKNV